jgi:hypothetical protein
MMSYYGVLCTCQRRCARNDGGCVRDITLPSPTYPHHLQLLFTVLPAS